MSKRQCFDVHLRAVTLAFMEHLSSPRAELVASLVCKGDWESLVTLRVDPLAYNPEDGDLFRRDYQAVEFLRKSPILPLDPAGRRKKALETFEECELACAETNGFLRNVDFCMSHTRLREDAQPIADILSRARKICRRILGVIPDDLHGRLGPGTTFELKGSTYTTVLDKMYTRCTVTPACRPLFEMDFDRTLWARARLESGLPYLGEARGNRFTTVPKDATKDRGICVEPLGNLWVQLGIGSYLKRRLSQVGLEVGVSPTASDPPNLWRRSNYRSGQEVHKELARTGSIDGSVATIDLSNASDTLAYELVRHVLPPDWFELLDAVRSPYTWVGDHWVRLEKFSSMGNGATFELETLVFAALIAAATGLKVGEEFKVYGDDIIVPASCSQTVLGVLTAFGFTPNARKTFVTGPFRESCGGDFFSGMDVRPSYSDSHLETPLDWIVLHNQLKAKWPRATAALAACINAIPIEYRKYGPPSLGDRVLHGPYRPKVGSDGIATVEVVVPQTPSTPLDRWSPELHMAAILSGGVDGGAEVQMRGGRRKTVLRPRVPHRGAPVGFRISSASVS